MHPQICKAGLRGPCCQLHTYPIKATPSFSYMLCITIQSVTPLFLGNPSIPVILKNSVEQYSRGSLFLVSSSCGGFPHCMCYLRIQTACREELPCSGHEDCLCHMGPDPLNGLCGHLNFDLLANASLQEALPHSFASFTGYVSGASSFTFRFRHNYPPPLASNSNLEPS